MMGRSSRHRNIDAAGGAPVRVPPDAIFLTHSRTTSEPMFIGGGPPDILAFLFAGDGIFGAAWWPELMLPAHSLSSHLAGDLDLDLDHLMDLFGSQIQGDLNITSSL